MTKINKNSHIKTAISIQLNYFYLFFQTSTLFVINFRNFSTQNVVVKLFIDATLAYRCKPALSKDCGY